jgi:hypothetical protein
VIAPRKVSPIALILAQHPIAAGSTLSQGVGGQVGEWEVPALIRDLTGRDVRRRVCQHDGDSDLEGVPGWSVEAKRHGCATRGDIAAWWAQTVSHAERAGAIPVLFYRLDRDAWRAIWPIAVHLIEQRAPMWTAYAWTAEGSVDAWAAVTRELDFNRPEPGGSLRRVPSTAAGIPPAAIHLKDIT